MFNNLKTGQQVWLQNCLYAPAGEATVVAVDSDHVHIEAKNGNNYKFTQEDVDANRILLEAPRIPTAAAVDPDLSTLENKLDEIEGVLDDLLEILTEWRSRSA